MKLFKPLKERKIFHLLADKDAFYGNKGNVIVFLNDCERLVIKVSTIKILMLENHVLHIVTNNKHWVVLFNHSLEHLLKHSRINNLIRLPIQNTQIDEKYAC